jgi:hypothetical protein
MNLKRYIEYDLSEAVYISGITRATLLNHIKWDWLCGRKKDDGKYYIEHNELLDYMAAQWDRGRLLMYYPEVRKNLMEQTITLQDIKLEQAAKTSKPEGGQRKQKRRKRR